MLRMKEQRVKGVIIEGVGQFQIVASISFLVARGSFSCIST